MASTRQLWDESYLEGPEATGLRRRHARWVVATALAGMATFGSDYRAAAEPVTLSRAIYWDLPDRNTDAARDISKLLSLGISEVHIFVNEPPPEPDDVAKQGLLFSYTNSDLPHGLPRWTVATLSEFVKALQAAKLKVVFTLSPQHRFEAYIADLSAPGKPLGLARQIGGIDIELDVEENWREDLAPKFCGPANWQDMPKRLADEIRDIRAPADQRKPLKLIVSRHPAFLQLADVIAPQLYEKYFGHSPEMIRDELSSKWFLKGRVFQPALTVFCRPGDHATECSQDIFDKSVKAVARLAKCDGRGKVITGLAIWSWKTIKENSVFGDAYLLDATKRTVDVSCAHP